MVYHAWIQWDNLAIFKIRIARIAFAIIDNASNRQSLQLWWRIIKFVSGFQQYPFLDSQHTINSCNFLGSMKNTETRTAKHNKRILPKVNSKFLGWLTKPDVLVEWKNSPYQWSIMEELELTNPAEDDADAEVPIDISLWRLSSLE